jgi:hypothetical protein
MTAYIPTVRKLVELVVSECLCPQGKDEVYIPKLLHENALYENHYMSS